MICSLFKNLTGFDTCEIFLNDHFSSKYSSSYKEEYF